MPKYEHDHAESIFTFYKSLLLFAVIRPNHMHFLRILLSFAIAVIGVSAQPARIELLSRPVNNAPRAGGSAISAAPEFSHDGKFVLFLSEAPNFTTNAPARGVLNLYMANLQTHATTLLSMGVDDKHANDAIL